MICTTVEVYCQPCGDNSKKLSMNVMNFRQLCKTGSLVPAHIYKMKGNSSTQKAQNRRLLTLTFRSEKVSVPYSPTYSKVAVQCD